MAVLVSFASALLLYFLLKNGFHLKYVYQHTSTHLPLIYRISAFWAGEEGSLLLWLWLLSILTVLVTTGRRNRSGEMAPHLLGILALVEAFFALMVVATSNPFETLPITPAEGVGMLPLLQNPGMVIHPPVLFLGYAAYTLPFAFALASIMGKEFPAPWVRQMRRWNLLAWTALGAGILIGGWWSYVELGWGGYWAWDPVENASLIPWLVGTAFLHSTLMEERRGRHRRLNLVLPAIAFALCLFATLVTRGGIIVSELHGFSSSIQPIAYYLFGFIAAVLVATFVLMARRQEQSKGPPEAGSFLSREGSFVLANILFCGAAGVVLLGTVYPTLVQAIRGNLLSLNASFYDWVIGPLMTVVILLMGICPLIGWRRLDKELTKRLAALGLAGLVVVLVFAILGIRRPFPLASAFVCAFVLVSLLWLFVRDLVTTYRIKRKTFVTGMASLLAASRRRYGAYLVHLAIVLIAIGVTGSTAYRSEQLVSLTPGESTSLRDYEIRYEGFSTDTLNESPETAQSHVRYATTLNVYRNGSRVTKLRPEKNYHWTLESPWVTEVAISSSLTDDLYVSLASLDKDGRAGFQLVINPLVSWIWIGGGVLLLGALLAAWPAKRRMPEEN